MILRFNRSSKYYVQQAIQYLRDLLEVEQLTVVFRIALEAKKDNPVSGKRYQRTTLSMKIFLNLFVNSSTNYCI